MPIFVWLGLAAAALLAWAELEKDGGTKDDASEPKQPLDKGPVRWVVKGKRTEKAAEKVLVSGLESETEAHAALDKRRAEEAEYAKTGGKPYKFLRVAKVRAKSQAPDVRQEATP